MDYLLSGQVSMNSSVANDLSVSFLPSSFTVYPSSGALSAFSQGIKRFTENHFL